jgi:CheY-like chemotaxis protein
LEQPVNRIVIAAVDDIFFASKIRATAEHLNVNVVFVRTAEEALAAVSPGTPVVLIADLHSLKIDVFELGQTLRNAPQFGNARFIGFYSHVQTELPKRALAAGFDEAVPRSLFTKQLAEILSCHE